MKTVSTPKGTSLPLVNLKGKDYLMVGHRLQWFNEVETRFIITTEFPVLTDEQTVARAQVQVFDVNTGNIIKSATATKRETKKDFSDHTEKAETSAIGRALAMLGYGTQFALSDLDEGERLADSPMTDARSSSKSVAPTSNVSAVASPTVTTQSAPVNNVTPIADAAPAKKPGRPSFRKNKPESSSGSTPSAATGGGLNL